VKPDALARIAILPDALYAAPISPLIYGDFIEFLGELIPGMRAEKVRDRAFEGVQPAKYIWPPDAQPPTPAWEPFVAGLPAFTDAAEHPAQLEMVPAAAQVVMDGERPFVGSQSARVEVRRAGDQAFVAGIAQRGIAVTAGLALAFEAYVRADAAVGGELTVLVGRSYGAFFRAYATLALRGVTGEWQRVAGSLVPDASDADASLAIGACREGTFWLDKVSLLPDDHLRGWRKDVVAAVRAMKPGCIRFGGSSLITYQWETGIGSRERRVPFVNHPWDNREEHDVGLHEFLDFCELVGAEPLICVNANSTTLAQVLDEIEYCNGPADTPYGRIRAAMGHPEPFDVRYWQIGNEQEGAAYEQVLAGYARAIRARHPGLVLLASYPSPRILAELSADLDYICPHFYDPYTREGEASLRTLATAIAETAQNKDLKIGVTEWNHTAGHWGWARAWLLTLYNALNAARMFNMYQRLGDLVRIANRSNLTNSVCSGVVQTIPSDLYLTPTYHVQAVYANFAGDVALSVLAGADDALDVAATRRSGDGEIAVFVVNPLDQPQRRQMDLSAMGMPLGPVRAWTLTGPSLDAANSFVEKQRVAPVESVLPSSGAFFEYVFLPYSLTLLRYLPRDRTRAGARPATG
jgi:alpha-N-arabinofuranosidase